MKWIISISCLCFSFVLPLFAAEKPLFVPNMVKVADQVSFIEGENILSEADLCLDGHEINQIEAPLTLEARAEAMSTVMVTRDGVMYESKVSSEDLAVFEEGIQVLQELGLDASYFMSPGMPPQIDPTEAKGKQLDQSMPTPERCVIGPDGRRRVTNTTSNPFRNIGRIALGCSGTLVGPRHVLTAGHCVANGRGSWFSALNFSAAQYGSSRPYGTTSWTNAFTTSQWFNNRDPRYDYGMIILANAPHGGFNSYGTYRGGNVTVTGYPGDKPTGTMWTHSGSSSSDSQRIYYTLDTVGGQSGSGVRDTGNTVRGIHAYCYSSRNGGTRINNTVFNIIQGWVSNN